MTTDVQKIPEQVSDERVTTVLHTMQDHRQRTTVMTQHRSLNIRSEQYRTQRVVLHTRPWALTRRAHAMRGAPTTRSATRQPWPRQAGKATFSRRSSNIKKPRNALSAQLNTAVSATEHGRCQQHGTHQKPPDLSISQHRTTNEPDTAFHLTTVILS